MLTYNELKKLSKKKDVDFEGISVALLGDTATQFLAQSIEGYAHLNKLHLNMFEADYNQIDSQVFDEDSETYNSSPEFIIIYMSTEKCYEMFCKIKLEQRDDFAQVYFNKILSYWDAIISKKNCKILQFSFAEDDDNIFGNYGCKTQYSFIYQLRKLNMMLMDGAQKYKNVFLIDLCRIQNKYGRKILFDEKFFCSANMTLSLDILPYVAKSVIDVINAIRSKIKKCVVLDLDNTLWGGVIGDDGINNIQIGELGAGKAFTDFQRWLKQLKERGILLTVCSKNNEDTAKEPFINHPDMILRLEDITMFVANWDDKATNIKYIQQTLNLGMDSFVFIDDNPFERNMVKSIINEITVPDLPEDPALYLSFLKELNLFETASYSEEDLSRTKQYQDEIKRSTTEKKYESIDDYLINLEMTAIAKPFEAFYYPRIAQLTQRSNQFNLRTIRYTEAEIISIAQSDRYITLYFTLEDKFGDYGLISVVILEKKDADTLFIEAWLMSCRVLKRGMEEFIINKIISVAQENGYQKVIGEYIKTQKNAMVADIYEKLGFIRTEEGKFIANVISFVKNHTYIKEKLQ